MNIERVAFESIRQLRPEHRESCLELPQLLRAHGLSAALGYWLTAQAGNGQDDAAAAQCRRAAADSFIRALHGLCPIGRPGQGIDMLADQLACEPHRTYLLHTRLALQLADAWAMMARTLLGTGNATGNTVSEATHATE